VPEDLVLAQFKELLAAAAPVAAEGPPQLSSAASCEILVRQLEPSLAHLLRLSAIPHHLDRDLLQILVPEREYPRIEEYWGFLSRLSVTGFSDSGLLLHDTARNYFFSRWLLEPGDEFRQVSARLRNFFRAQSERGEDQQARDLAAHQAVFHSIGADQGRGMCEFEELARAHRRVRRFTEFASMIRLVHEYDPILSEESCGILSYHEGKLAADRNQWDQAALLFEQVLANRAVAPALHMRSDVRLGLLYLNRHEWDRAIEAFHSAQEMISQVESGSGHRALILQDLAVAYRERGDRHRSEQLLAESIRLAQQDGNLGCLASSWNSLGTLHRSYKEFESAISAFEKSLEYLARDGDRFGRAAVLNNLGGVYSDMAEWPKSEAFYKESLQVSREAADTIGQARTLANLVPVYRNQNRVEEAIQAANWAVACFADLHDYNNAAVATVRIARVYRSLRRRAEAEEAYRQAESLFDKAGATQDRITTAEERSRMIRATGLPWWAWVLILIGVAIVTLVVWFVYSIARS
jgi:tetratricopeptide (TPR) repeat protein